MPFTAPSSQQNNSAKAGGILLGNGPYRGGQATGEVFRNLRLGVLANRERGRPFRASPAALCIGEAKPFPAEHLPQCSNLLLLVRDDRFLLAMNPAGQHRQDRVGRGTPEVQCHTSHTTLDWEIRRVERGELGSWNR